MMIDFLELPSVILPLSLDLLVAFITAAAAHE
jgi:hypothetical protein